MTALENSPIGSTFPLAPLQGDFQRIMGRYLKLQSLFFTPPGVKFPFCN